MESAHEHLWYMYSQETNIRNNSDPPSVDKWCETQKNGVKNKQTGKVVHPHLGILLSSSEEQPSDAAGTCIGLQRILLTEKSNPRTFLDEGFHLCNILPMTRLWSQRKDYWSPGVREGRAGGQWLWLWKERRSPEKWRAASARLSVFWLWYYSSVRCYLWTTGTGLSTLLLHINHLKVKT